MRKIVIGVSLIDEQQTEELKHLKNSGILEDAEIHLVSVFKIGKFINELSLYEYPSTDQYEEIQKSVEKILDDLSKEIVPQSSMNSVHKACLFHSNPKIKVKEYLEEQKADLVVVAVRQHGVEGLFSSSFTDFLCKSSPCDVYVVRSNVTKS